MNKIKFYDLPTFIKDTDFDGDKTDLRIHSNESIYWGTPRKREYEKIEKRIDKFNRSGNGWSLYTWCDISGFQYWIKNQEENNYVQISISFDTEDILESEIIPIKEAIEDAIYEFSDLPSLPITY